ncbi:MAG: FAD-binding oxidoreductase [Dehalococcoidia bacterium]|jgi:glycine/D-amino acid oxidase-like deaminating enzyme|nr:FAD-binding oxidoreductase [Dehalococcoidia bacterium]
MTSTADIVIVGGGVHGASTAWHLANREAGKIVLIEKEGIGSGASGWSSAIVRLHYTLESLVKVTMYGREMFGEWKDIVGIGESGFRKVGFLILFDTSEVEHAREIIAMQQRLGIDARMITPDEVGAIEPRLARDDVAAGAWEPNSGHADGSSVANSFTAAARELGVEVLIGPEVLRVTNEGSRVTGVETTVGTIEAGTVIVEAGFRTSALLADHGVDLPINPVRHAIAVVERTPDFGDIHPVVSDRIVETYYRPEANSLALLGEHDPLRGLVDEDVEAIKRPDLEEQTSLFQRFAARFPGQDAASLVRGYTGVYDCSPDYQPAFGRVQALDGLFIGAGFSGHGFKLSPGIGKILSDLVVDGSTDMIDVRPFRVERFAEGDPLTEGEGYANRSLA